MAEIRKKATHLLVLFLCFLSARCLEESDQEVRRSHFPNGFLFGTATSAHQIEGAYLEDGKGLNNWDAFSHIPGNIKNNDNADTADNHYHLFLENQGGSIGIVLSAMWYEPLREDEVLDQQAVSRALAFASPWLLDPLVYGDYPSEMRLYLGATLPSFTAEQMDYVKGSIDFIGLNHYSTLYVKDCLHSSCPPGGSDHAIRGYAYTTGERDGVTIGPPTGNPRFFIVPSGMENIVNYLKERYNNMPLYVTENGYGPPADEAVQLEQVLEDTSRIEYHKSYLAAVARSLRCDLVVFAASGASEKLASGLLQPFVSHLKTANDQISKGGYSIILRPSSSSPISSTPWFTKATLQRFVRFVSTPEVLERFVTIETELEQIESSVHSHELYTVDAQGIHKSNVSSKDGVSDAAPKESSKVHLQRALESRKAILHKEQAMAYARALVTGFELDSIYDLMSFADAFGASRLREACINFTELCKKKNQDRLWVDEIVAMQAAHLELPSLRNSGITLAGEESYPSQLPALRLNGSIDASDSATSIGSVDLSQDSSLPPPSAHQAAVPWQNHLPHYMHNFQGPVYQQMAPYQGYGANFPSPYFPGNMQYDPNMQIQTKSSSRKQKKNSSHAESNQDGSTDGGSSSDTESEQNKTNDRLPSPRRKKHSKKSSRTVVIRNINYIASRRDGNTSGEESEEDEFINGEALKQQVEEAVGSLERRNKSARKSQRHQSSDMNIKNEEQVNEKDQWSSFQNLLMKDDDADTYDIAPKSFQADGEYLEAQKQRKQQMEASDSFVATNRDTTSEPQTRIQNFEGDINDRFVMKNKDECYDDLLFSQRPEKSDNPLLASVSDFSSESPVIKVQKGGGDWFVGTQMEKSVYKNGNEDINLFDGEHPCVAGKKKDVLADDSFMIQDRSFGDDGSHSIIRTDISMVADVAEFAQCGNGVPDPTQEKVKAVDSYEPDDLYMVLGRDVEAEKAVPSWTPEIDYENDILSAEINRKGSTVEKTDAEINCKASGKEVNKSKVSGGNLGRSKSEIASKTRKPSLGSRTTLPKIKSQRHPFLSAHNQEEENRKKAEAVKLERQKRIAARSSANSASNDGKSKMQSLNPGQGTKKTVFRSSTMDRLATARTTAKVESAQQKQSQSKSATSKVNGAQQKAVSGGNKKPSAKPGVTEKKKKIAPVAIEQKSTKLLGVQATTVTSKTVNMKDNKEVPRLSVEKNVSTDTAEGKFCNDAPPLAETEVGKASNDFVEDISGVMIHPTPDKQKNMSDDAKVEKKNDEERTEDSALPQKSQMEICTPPPSTIVNPEQIHARKKWNSGETSPKGSKVLRKLLFFGKRT
ncbi:COP1-interacting protein 7 [Linum grandiflorum]